MRAKRSLGLEIATESSQNEKSAFVGRHDPNAYSPITGTRRMSPSLASKHQAAANARKRRIQNDAGTSAAKPEPSSRGQTSPEEKVDILGLLSQVEGSLDEFLKVRQRLTKAVGGSRELGNLLCVDCGALDLKTEMQKTKVLILKVRKRKRQRPR